MKSSTGAAVLILACCVMVACEGGGLAATEVVWDNGAGTGLWDTNASNWNPDQLPDLMNYYASIEDANTVPVDGAKNSNRLHVGNGGELHVGDGDSLTIVSDVLIASSFGSGPNGTITQTGGLFHQQADNGIIIGHDRAGGVYNLLGGTLHAGVNLTVGWASGGFGTLAISGGTVTADANLVAGRAAGASGDVSISGSAVVNIAADARWGLAAPCVLTVTGGDATITVGNNMTFDLATSELHANIDATGFSTINVTGSIINNGTLSVTATGPMVHGQHWTLIDANGILSGTAAFANAPEGSTVFDNGTMSLRINYGTDGDALLFAVAAGAPVVSAPTVTNITTTTALGGVTLTGTNAYVTLFWGENDEGRAFTWDATNALTAEQSTGAIDGVAISNLTIDTQYFCIFYASNSISGLAGWSSLNQSFASALTGKSVSNLSAGAANALEIDLSWTDNFNAESGYVIQRSPDGLAWAPLATTVPNASSYADTSVSALSTYHYRVAATNGAGLSDWSRSAEATTPAGITNPGAPRHWWKLDEPSGTVVRDFGLTGGMDGTILGASSTRVTPANSRVGNALDVSTGWSYVSAGDVPITNSFTASLWVDPNNVNDDWRGFIGKWSVVGRRTFWLGQHASNGYLRYGLSFNGTAEAFLDSPTNVIGNNCWQMITAVWDEVTKEQRLYVNGVLKASAVRPGQTLTTPRLSPLTIMALNDNLNQFYGTVDDVRLYDRALTDDEIRSLYANPGVEAPALTIMARDDFNGPALQTGWALDDREVADSHDLAARPGWLRVAIAAAENTWLNNRDGSAMLYTDAPHGSFTMETRVDIATGNGGTPVAQSSGGIAVYDPSYVTAQYPFALYFWLGHNGATTALSLQKPGGNLATAIAGVSSHLYLRLYRNADGGTWVASYKVELGDAWTEWVTIADGDLPNGDVSDGAIYVGIMTKTWAANPARIDYDYFEIPEAVEPLGTLLIIQ